VRASCACGWVVQGGGRIARERLGVFSPKKWEQNKVRGQASGGVVKKRRYEDGSSSKGNDTRDARRNKDDLEQLRKKKKSYKDLIKRS